MALVVCETALVFVTLAEAVAGVWATALVRAGPNEIARIAAGLRSTLPIFTVDSCSLELGFMASAKNQTALALGAVLVALLDHRLTTCLRGRGANPYDPCANNYL